MQTILRDSDARVVVEDSGTGIETGAEVDFLTKPVDETALVDAVNNAVSLAQHRISEDAYLADLRERIAGLTPRELDVMHWVLRGALNKQIAAHLGIAEKAVKIHRGRVMKKLGLTTVAELVRICQGAGITPAAGLKT